MSESIHARSPLHVPARESVGIREIPLLGYVNLRGPAADAAFVRIAADTIGVSLPVGANTFSGEEGLLAVWLGPDEWLLVTAPDRQQTILPSLATALAGQHVAVTDVSSGYTTIAVSGARARDLLAKGCTIDLHPRVFGVGRSAQTVIAKAGVLIRQVDEAPTFLITVRRSFASYLWQWLTDATREFDGL